MTRENQYINAAAQYLDDPNRYLGFMNGAEWADSHPHWISVEDELPTCNVFVLTCDGQGNTNLLMLAGNGGWYDHSVAKHRNITHWMPLPEPPEHLAGVSKMISLSEKPNNCKQRNHERRNL